MVNELNERESQINGLTTEIYLAGVRAGRSNDIQVHKEGDAIRNNKTQEIINLLAPASAPEQQREKPEQEEK